jgi:hypothetical protein
VEKEKSRAAPKVLRILNHTSFGEVRERRNVPESLITPGVQRFFERAVVVRPLVREIAQALDRRCSTFE